MSDDVRRQDGMLGDEQRISIVDRFRGEHVDRHAAEAALTEGVGDRTLIDDSAARRVDQDCAALERAEAARG